MKTLVAYFSAGGTTARVAGEIASAVGGDLFEIRPQASDANTESTPNRDRLPNNRPKAPVKTNRETPNFRYPGSFSVPQLHGEF